MGIRATSTVTSKGQVTLPKAVRDRLGIHAGDKIELTEDGGGFRVTKVCPENPFVRWLGYLKDLEGQDPDELIEDWRGR